MAPSAVGRGVGSSYPAGDAWLSDLRQYCPEREYIGCDLGARNGVDRIEDGDRLTFTDASAPTMLAYDALEHRR